MATTMSKHGSSINRQLCEFAGLSLDQKPIEWFTEESGAKVFIQNGSKFIEMDTDTKYLYDAENKQWKEV